MPRFKKIKGIDRIIDANINRTKEGLRVCEEIARFILQSHMITADFKKIRHKIDALVVSLNEYANFLKERKSLEDIGRNIYINELKRKNYQDIFFANIQRIKESVRVLEEFSKLKNTHIAQEFKKIRYQVYELEKKVTQRISSLYHYR